MRALPYISSAGIKKTVMEAGYQDKWHGNFVYVDHDVYEKMMKPAYTDIHGRYPEKADEIMLPLRCLEQMGMETPKTGEVLTISVKSGEKEEEKEFVLSGFYTDYIDAAINIPEAYVSHAFITENNLSLYPADKLMALPSSLDSGEEMESRLYSDIDMEYDSQQIFSENPMILQSIEGFTGSIAIAAGCTMLVIACAFMLIYNAVSISTAKNIREYGLLKVIGTTKRQLKRIVYRQSIWNILKGIAAGSAAGIVFAAVFLEKVLRQLFMQGYGSCDVRKIYPVYLIFAVILASLTTFLAVGTALRQAIKWNAVRSLHYTEADAGSRKKRIKSKDKVSLFRMAYRNITKSKRKLVVSSAALILGGITALASAVIMRGADLRNLYQQEPDFQIGILGGIFRYPEKVPVEINDDTEMISGKTVKDILNMDGVIRSAVRTVRGSYALISFEDTALKPRKQSMELSSDETDFATIQIISNDYAEHLAEYAEKYDLPLDAESLKDGTGCVLLHYHEMSKILNEQAETVIGEPINFYSLNAYGKKENIDVYRKNSLKCAGYIDRTAKYFPELSTTSMGNGIHYFIMTDKAFQKLKLPGKVFNIEFDVQEGKKGFVHQKLSQIVQRENIKSGEKDNFYMVSGYTLLETEQNRIRTGNLILGTLTFIILLAGIMNFANMLLSDYSVRKRELAIMESIGLTKDQLWKMIFLEGFWYWLIVMAGLLLSGSAVIYGMGILIKQRLLYFKFVYPWKELAFIAVMMLILNLIFAVFLYHKNYKEPLSERIKV